jgi:hypothetical protein
MQVAAMAKTSGGAGKSNDRAIEDNGAAPM